MKLHTVFITYNRLELTKRAIESYLETVTMPFTLMVVDNGSEDETTDWLQGDGPPDFSVLFLSENRYPGYATNRGWSEAPDDTTHLHRADNDFEFLSDWCNEVERVFQSKRVGQVGLRTASEECLPGRIAPQNVGGNCVIRRKLWDKGLRWDERPWPQICEEVGTGQSEDALFSPAVRRMGYKWTRVKRKCIRKLEENDMTNPYYIKSLGDRGIGV